MATRLRAVALEHDATLAALVGDAGARRLEADDAETLAGAVAELTARIAGARDRWLAVLAGSRDAVRYGVTLAAAAEPPRAVPPPGGARHAVLVELAGAGDGGDGIVSLLDGLLNGGPHLRLLLCGPDADVVAVRALLRVGEHPAAVERATLALLVAPGQSTALLATGRSEPVRRLPAPEPGVAAVRLPAPPPPRQSPLRRHAALLGALVVLTGTGAAGAGLALRHRGADGPAALPAAAATPGEQTFPPTGRVIETPPGAASEVVGTPPGREAPAVGYNPVTDAIVVVGGVVAGHVVADTWQLGQGGWMAGPLLDPPAARFGAALGFDPRSTGLVLLPGNSGIAADARAGEVCVLGGAIATAGGRDGWSCRADSPVVPPCPTSATDDSRHGLVAVSVCAAADGRVTSITTFTYDGGRFTALAASAGFDPAGAPTLVEDPVSGLLLAIGFTQDGGGTTRMWRLGDDDLWHVVSPAHLPDLVGHLPVAASDPRDGEAVLYIDETGETWTWDGFDWTSHAAQPPGDRPAVALGAYTTRDGLARLLGGRSTTTNLTQLWSWNGTRWDLFADLSNDMGPAPASADPVAGPTP